MENRISVKDKLTKDFINKSIKKYGDKYEYENLDYVNNYSFVNITCREHGDFKMVASAFLTRSLSSEACLECRRKEGLARFIKLSNMVHSEKYDYSNVNFTNTNTKVEIICPEHGSFMQEPYLHYGKKQGCPKCAIESGRNDLDYFINMSKIKHGNTYDYSKSIYVDNKTNIEIICKVHGSFFQRPASHYKAGHGCRKCTAEKLKVGIDNFIKISNSLHKDKYDYSKSVYVGNKIDLEIICPTHGSFLQRPNSHMSGQGCPKCKSSKGETAVLNILDKYGIDNIREYKIDGFKYRYDFYLPKHNILIEFNGKQHYSPIDRFGGVKTFLENKKRDRIKKFLAAKNKINLIVIHHNFLYKNEIEKKLIKEFKKIYKHWLVIDSKIVTVANDYELCKQFTLPGETMLNNALETLLHRDTKIKPLFKQISN